MNTIVPQITKEAFEVEVKRVAEEAKGLGAILVFPAKSTEDAMKATSGHVPCCSLCGGMIFCEGINGHRTYVESTSG